VAPAAAAPGFTPAVGREGSVAVWLALTAMAGDATAGATAATCGASARLASTVAASSPATPTAAVRNVALTLPPGCSSCVVGPVGPQARQWLRPPRCPMA